MGPTHVFQITHPITHHRRRMQGQTSTCLSTCMPLLTPCLSYITNTAMQHRLPPATMTATSPRMHTTTKTPHLLASESEAETPNQRSEQEDQGIEDTERRHWSYKKAHAQQPSARSLTSSNSSSSGGSGSDGDDADDGLLQHQPLALSRSSLMARRWGQASSALSDKAAADVMEEGDDSPSKPRPQALYVMNKARDLCARIRHQAKVKQREERKRILLQRQVVRDVARQAAENAREEEAREAALRREEEAIKAARREQELAEKQRHEGECLQAKVFTQEQEGREERLVQAAKMERLREGVLLWDRWAKQRAVFIWYVKAQHMSKLEQQQQQQQQKQQQEAEEKKARATAAAAAVVLAPSLSSFAGWAVDAVKWVKWQVDRACAPPRRPKSPSYYLDEC